MRDDQTGPGDGPQRVFWRHSRRWLLIAVVAIAVLPAMVVGAVTLFADSTNPPRPDAFYAAPSPLPAGSSGTVIRTEVVSHPPAGSKGWKILYLSRS